MTESLIPPIPFVLHNVAALSSLFSGHIFSAGFLLIPVMCMFVQI